jgi:hypothetical protein
MKRTTKIGQLLKTASTAAKSASKWHQGSGIHADSMYAALEDIAEMLKDADKGKIELIMAAAESVTQAAVAEDKYMKTTHGEGWDLDEWKESISGKAYATAEKACAAIDICLNDYL